MANIYGIDLGTCNIKIFSKHSNKIIKEKIPLRLLTRISYMHMAMKHMLCMKSTGEYQCIIPGYRRSDRRL